MRPTTDQGAKKGMGRRGSVRICNDKRILRKRFSICLASGVLHECIIALPLSENATASQFWRFVALEVRVMSPKNEALQALSIPQNVVWDPLTFRAMEIDQSVHHCRRPLVNQSVTQR